MNATSRTAAEQHADAVMRAWHRYGAKVAAENLLLHDGANATDALAALEVLRRENHSHIVDGIVAYADRRHTAQGDVLTIASEYTSGQALRVEFRGVVAI